MAQWSKNAVYAGLLDLGRAFIKSGETEKAEEHLRAMLHVWGDQAQTLAVLAEAFEARGTAKLASERSLKGRMEILFESGPFAMAQRTYKDAIDRAAQEENGETLIQEIQGRCARLSDMIDAERRDLVSRWTKQDGISELLDLDNPVPLSAHDIGAQMIAHVFQGGLLHDHYRLWSKKRINKVVEILGEGFFDGKRVLELGAGYGDIGAEFAQMGCTVVCLDGLEGNCRVARQRHQDIENIQFIQCNLEEDFSKFGDFDFIINFGLMYHIRNFEAHLKCCMGMSDRIFLETVVADSTDPDEITFFEESPELLQLNDSAVEGTGAYASPFYIEKIFKQHGFGVQRHFSADLNSAHHKYDWPHDPTRKYDDVEKFGLRRFWYFFRE